MSERVCFVFELHKGAEEAYDLAHQPIPVELERMIQASGVTDYSIFRDGTRLYAVLKADPNWQEAKAKMAASPEQADWERQMAPLISWQLDVRGEVKRLPEVFRLRAPSESQE